MQSVSQVRFPIRITWGIFENTHAHSPTPTNRISEGEAGAWLGLTTPQVILMYSQGGKLPC